MKKVNKSCIDLIKSFEGLFLKPYLDPIGIPTIGYGTIKYPDGKKVTMNDSPITEKQALEYLEFEIHEKALGVENMIIVSLNDNEFGALVSFAYNLGLGNLKKSTLLKLLNSGKEKSIVAEEFLKWNKAGGKVLTGLTRRRQAEKALFLQPSDTQDIFNTPSEQEIEDKLKKIEEKILKK